MSISSELPPSSPDPLWRVTEIPKTSEPEEATSVDRERTAPTFPASLYLAEEREATEREQTLKDRRMDGAGFTENRAEEARTGVYIDKYPVRSLRKKKKNHYFPSKQPDGDTGLNDPYYAGSKGLPVFTETDHLEAEKLAKTVRLEKIQRDIVKFMSEGMEREVAEDRAYALHRHHTGEVVERPHVYKSPAEEFIAPGIQKQETFDDSLDGLLPTGIAPETAPESREHVRRLRQVVEKYGFYFHTLKEGNKINRFILKAKSGVAVVDYLDMIYRGSRQGEHSSTNEVEKAFATIGGYASESLDTITMVQDFERQLESDHLRADGYLTEENHFPVADWAQDRQFIETLTRLAHYVETAEFARTGKNDVLFEKNRIDRVQGTERIRRILDVLNGFTIDELRSVCATAIESEFARFQYWQARVKEAEGVLPIRDQAEARSYALRSRALGIEV